MRQTEGERDFVAPPLRSAPVFGGIAGIVIGESGAGEENAGTPHISARAHESSKQLQDMYRRNLAASWAAQAGELPAHECIDDIFSGGDGWAIEDDNEQHDSFQISNGRTSASSAPKKSTKGFPRRTSGKHVQSNHPLAFGSLSMSFNLDDNAGSKQRHMQRFEVNEFEEREDLRSWQISRHG